MKRPEINYMYLRSVEGFCKVVVEMPALADAAAVWDLDASGRSAVQIVIQPEPVVLFAPYQLTERAG